MPKIAYIDKRFRNESLYIIGTANDILKEYAIQGYDLTLRQLYYQFVARDLFPESWIDKNLGTKNTQKNYKRLGKMVNDGRLAGLIDWDSIVDRTRNLQRLGHWDDPQDIILSAAKSYRLDKWLDQESYVEVWIEKDALVGVIENVCDKWDVPYFSCRGYVSQSEMWRAAQRIRQVADGHRNVVMLQLSDHDPSGLDIKRDIIDRHELFGAEVDVRRLALTHDQVVEFSPPPNPTKMSDTRAPDYVDEYGYESWELDALEPSYISSLIEENILDVLDKTLWTETCSREELQRETIEQVANRWSEVEDFLRE